MEHNAPPKILLVEDDKAIQKMYEVGFTGAGFNVSTAQNGGEGLEMAKQIKPDIVLLDIVMPRYDGYWFLAKARREPALTGIPILVLTNLGAQREREEILKCGAAECLWKIDWTPSFLIPKVKGYLSMRERKK